MQVRRFVSAALVAAMFVGVMPAAGWAGTQPAPTQAATRFQASIDHAIATAVASQQARSHTQKPAARSSASASAVQSGGGGGSKAWIVWSVVGAAVGIGSAYYMVKELKKAQQQGQ